MEVRCTTVVSLYTELEDGEEGRFEAGTPEFLEEARCIPEGGDCVRSGCCSGRCDNLSNTCCSKADEGPSCSRKADCCNGHCGHCATIPGSGAHVCCQETNQERNDTADCCNVCVGGKSQAVFCALAHDGTKHCDYDMAY